MNDSLEEIKQKIDLVTFIAEYLPLKKAGRNFKGLCPFHSEKTSSFVVSPERQIWHCFGCNSGGDVFGFLMKIENLEFVEALEILAKKAGVQLRTGSLERKTRSLRDKIYEINHLAAEFYHYLLLNHPSGKKALDYIRNRGVKQQTLETFGLGYSPQMWDGLSKFLTKKGYTVQEMELAGLVVKGSNYYDRFRGRLMFSLKDVRGNVVGFAGRMIPSVAEGTNTDQAKYINTPETPVYTKGNVLYGLEITKEAIRKEDRAIVVEGELDLISSFQAGVSNIVAIKGSALTEGQVNLLKRYTQNLTLALDMDAAGEAACKRGIEIADKSGLTVNVASLPNGKDPDECARTNPSGLKEAVKKALPVFDYYLNSAVSRYEVQTAQGKKKISEEVLPVLMRISNPIVQAHYLSRLGQTLGVSEEIIRQTGLKLYKKEQINRVDNAVFSQKISTEDRLEEYLLSFFLQPADLKNLFEEDLEKFLSSGAVKKIYGLLKKAYCEPDFKPVEFIKSLPGELVSVADRAYLEDLSGAEFKKAVSLLKKKFYKNELLGLAKKMQTVEDKEETALLSAHYRQIAKELTTYEK